MRRVDMARCLAAAIAALGALIQGSCLPADPPPRRVFEEGEHRLDPGEYPGGILVTGSARVTFAAGNYTFSGVPDGDADIVVEGRAEVRFETGASILLDDSTSGLCLEARGGEVEGPTILVGGAQEGPAVEVQGKIRLVGACRLSVENVTWVRSPHRTAASGGDTVLEGGTLTMTDCVVTPGRDGRVGHDITATGTEVSMARCRYEQGSIFLNDSGLVMEADSHIGIGLYLKGRAWADVIDSRVSVMVPNLPAGDWGRFERGGEFDEAENAIRYDSHGYNLAPSVPPTARDRMDPDRFGYYLRNALVEAWVFRLNATDPARRLTVRLSGFRGRSDGFALDLMLRDVGGPDDMVDLGTLAAGDIVRISPENDYSLAMLGDRAGIDLTVEDSYLFGWNLYLSGASRVRAACDRSGMFGETEAFDESRLIMHHSNIDAAYLSVENSAAVTVEDCTLSDEILDLRCIGDEGKAPPSLEMVRTEFRRPSPDVGRTVVASRGVVTIEDCRPGPAVVRARNGSRVELRRSGSPEVDADESSTVIVDGVVRIPR
ncbi:MAG: hypothetical protein HYY17_08405 [Planctomycetes bacterium]|nr:hypothetical protein [Planctomycetota bacterium]